MRRLAFRVLLAVLDLLDPELARRRALVAEARRRNTASELASQQATRWVEYGLAVRLFADETPVSSLGVPDVPTKCPTCLAEISEARRRALRSAAEARQADLLVVAVKCQAELEAAERGLRERIEGAPTIQEAIAEHREKASLVEANEVTAGYRRQEIAINQKFAGIRGIAHSVAVRQAAAHGTEEADLAAGLEL